MGNTQRTFRRCSSPTVSQPAHITADTLDHTRRSVDDTVVQGLKTSVPEYGIEDDRSLSRRMICSARSIDRFDHFTGQQPAVTGVDSARLNEAGQRAACIQELTDTRCQVPESMSSVYSHSEADTCCDVMQRRHGDQVSAGEYFVLDAVDELDRDGSNVSDDTARTVQTTTTVPVQGSSVASQTSTRILSVSCEPSTHRIATQTELGHSKHNERCIENRDNGSTAKLQQTSPSEMSSAAHQQLVDESQRLNGLHGCDSVSLTSVADQQISTSRQRTAPNNSDEPKTTVNDVAQLHNDQIKVIDILAYEHDEHVQTDDDDSRSESLVSTTDSCSLDANSSSATQDRSRPVWLIELDRNTRIWKLLVCSTIVFA